MTKASIITQMAAFMIPMATIFMRMDMMNMASIMRIIKT